MRKISRDAYVKELQKNNNWKSGSLVPTTSSFAHFQRLSFLKQVVQKKFNDNNYSFDVEEISANIDSNSVKSPTENVPRKKYKLHRVDEYFANILQRSINTCYNNLMEKKEDDVEDKFFCLSLEKKPENRLLK